MWTNILKQEIIFSGHAKGSFVDNAWVHFTYYNWFNDELANKVLTFLNHSNLMWHYTTDKTKAEQIESTGLMASDPDSSLTGGKGNPSGVYVGVKPTSGYGNILFAVNHEEGHQNIYDANGRRTENLYYYGKPGEIVVQPQNILLGKQHIYPNFAIIASGLTGSTGIGIKSGNTDNLTTKGDYGDGEKDWTPMNDHEDLKQWISKVKSSTKGNREIDNWAMSFLPELVKFKIGGPVDTTPKEPNPFDNWLTNNKETKMWKAQLQTIKPNLDLDIVDIPDTDSGDCNKKLRALSEYLKSQDASMKVKLQQVIDDINKNDPPRYGENFRHRELRGKTGEIKMSGDTDQYKFYVPGSWAFAVSIKYGYKPIPEKHACKLIDNYNDVKSTDLNGWSDYHFEERNISTFSTPNQGPDIVARTKRYKGNSTGYKTFQTEIQYHDRENSENSEINMGITSGMGYPYSYEVYENIREHNALLTKVFSYLYDKVDEMMR